MADIDAYLEQIRTAIYGEDVREAIYESIKAVNGSIKELTWEEYKALPAHTKLEETVYFITDTKQIIKRGIVYGDNGSGGATNTADGTTLLFNAASAPVKTLDIYLRPYQDDHGWGNVWAGGTGKNKFQVTASSAQVDGITFIVDSFGRVTCNGTAEDNILFSLGTFSSIGKFTFNGCAEGATPPGSNRNYYLNIASTPLDEKQCYGPDVEIDNTSGATLNVDIWIKSGVTLDDAVFEPMIRSKGNGKFTPYANICPITKRSSIHINSHGTNIYNWLDPNKMTVHDYIIDPDDITKQISTPGFGYTYCSKVQPNVAYTFSGKTIDFGDVMYIYEYDKNENIISCSEPISYDMLPYTFTTGRNARYFGFSFKESSYDPTTIQLQIGAEGTVYEYYNDHYDDIYSIGKSTWGGTYYALEGKLDENWVEIASYAGEDLPGYWYSNMETYSDSRNPTIGAQVVYQTSQSTRENVNAIMFNTLLGGNSVWTDNDDEMYLVFVNQTWEDVTRTAKLTNEQYNSLSEADQHDGTIRFITDKGVIMLDGVMYGGSSGGGSHFGTMVIANRERSNSVITVTETEE